MKTMESFLKEFTKNTTKKQTHLSFIGGKYNISNDHLDEFYKLYFKTLKENFQKEPVYLIEKVNLNGKINYYQDLDIPMDEKDTDNIVSQVIKISNFVFAQNDSSTEDVVPIVAKRNDWRYHIHYPIMMTPKEAATITKTIRDVLGKRGMCLDLTVYRTGLRMIGSRKDSSDKENYYRIYNLDTKEYIQFTDPQFTYELFTSTCITCVEAEESEEISAEESREMTPLEQEICEFLQSSKEIFGELDFDIRSSTIKETTNRAGIPSLYINPREKLVCPFKGRSHSRKTNPVYIELNGRGASLRCFDEDCIVKRFPDLGIPIPFSRFPILSEKLSIGNGNGNGISNGGDELNFILMASLSGTHFNIAKVLYHVYKSRFMVDDVRNADWYEFEEARGKWKKSYNMNIHVSEDFADYYRTLKTDNGDTSAPFNEHIDRLVNKLESVTFKTSVLNEAKYLFYQSNPRFIEYLDNNPYLIGFENGVYDLKAKIFRKGTYEDYITFSTGYDWCEYDENHPDTIAIYKFLSEILPNETVREWTLGILGRSLIGFPDEKFYIWTGLSGANGKSTLVNFLEMTLGDYATSQDVALLTNKRAASNAATPEIIDIKGKRMVFFQEPEPTDRLRTGILKQFTGGDTIRARELYKKPISFRSMSNFFMCCNDLPHVSALDGGTWRRIRVTEFTSRFCDDPKKPNEFRIDPQLKWKLEEWKPRFMSILIHYYHKYAGSGVKLVEPPEVNAATARYKTDNDKYNDFFEECLEESTSAFCSTLELFSAFEFWWKGNYLNEKMPSKSEFKMALRNKYGEELIRTDPTTKRKLKGFPVTIRENDDDVFRGDELS